MKSLTQKKHNIGATIRSPEGFKNTFFRFQILRRFLKKVWSTLAEILSLYIWKNVWVLGWTKNITVTWFLYLTWSLCTLILKLSFEILPMFDLPLKESPCSPVYLKYLSNLFICKRVYYVVCLLQNLTLLTCTETCFFNILPMFVPM